jgi:hypothetical protein
MQSVTSSLKMFESGYGMAVENLNRPEGKRKREQFLVVSRTAAVCYLQIQLYNGNKKAEKRLFELKPGIFLQGLAN